MGAVLENIQYLNFTLFIFRYIYTGHFIFSNKIGTELLDIMFASDELKLKDLTKLIEDFIIENHHQFLQNDSIGVLQIAYCCQIFNNIQKYCFEMICLKPEILFNSVKFIDLPAPVLEIILKRDDLRLDEIEIWENLIKWV